MTNNRQQRGTKQNHSTTLIRTWQTKWLVKSDLCLEADGIAFPNTGQSGWCCYADSLFFFISCRTAICAHKMLLLIKTALFESVYSAWMTCISLLSKLSCLRTCDSLSCQTQIVWLKICSVLLLLGLNPACSSERITSALFLSLFRIIRNITYRNFWTTKRIWI